MASEMKISALNHPIKSVTVFKSTKAEVTRTFSLDLQAGQNKIQISELSSAIDTESVRVSGLGETRLFDLVCTIKQKHDADLSRDSSSEVIRLLNVRKQNLICQKRVLDHESELLVSYAKTLNGEHVTPTAMGEFLKSFVEKGSENLESVAKIEGQVVEVTRMIEKEKAKAALKKGETEGQVIMVVVATEDCAVDLNLTYIVSGAVWQPTYELHANMENGKPSSSVSLHYRARITQSTGEDWTNAALTLSTVTSDTVAKSVPCLWVTKIRTRNSQDKNNGTLLSNTFGNKVFVASQQQQQMQQPAQAQIFGAQKLPVPQLQQPMGLFGSNVGGTNTSPFGSSGGRGFGTQQLPVQQPFGLFGSNAGGASLFGSTLAGTSFGSAAVPPTAEPPAAAQRDDDAFSNFEEVTIPTSESTTVVTESPLSVSYAVEGESTIPSDGVAHQVSIVVLSFESKVTYVCCPRIEARVYLQCEVKNTSEYRLLPGPVSVFLDDSYVSKTTIQDVNPSDTFDCTLGADPATRISYSRTIKTVRDNSGTFAEASNTTTYTTTTTVHNKHRFPLSEITIRDVLPLSEDKRVKIILRKPAGLADAKDGQAVDLKAPNQGLKVRWSPLVDGKGGEKEGRFEFLGKMDAGAKVTVECQWEVKAPADLIWHEAPF